MKDKGPIGILYIENTSENVEHTNELRNPL